MRNFTVALAILGSMEIAQASDMLTSSNENVLTGDTALACNAILCLSSSTQPAECAPALNRYFDIKRRRWSKTLKARRNFLNLCPTVHEDREMVTLVNVILQGAGRCDAVLLNQILRSRHDGDVIISSRMPDYCVAYAGHRYTNLTPPRYAGTPSNGGRWVEAKDYERALAENNERLGRMGSAWQRWTITR